MLKILRIAAAISQVTYTESSDLLENNRRFHKLLTTGVEVEYILNEEIVNLIVGSGV
ncbi:hypothetical protein WKK05_05410 [Nostoc sp. UHCC 0302]|uniref:hypothetical protein n=1 Tax=Nostoc sp. UHCC 0302 TaxID=3134896 RepID=UPI00311CC1AB